MIAASTLIFAIIGGFLGYVLGEFAPDYYRSVFARTDSDFNSVQVGLGLGMTQGAAAGAFMGFGLVALAAWFDSRRADRVSTDDRPR